MATAPTLIVFPASLHGGHWAAGPRVKAELVSMHTVLRRGGGDVRVLDLENEVGNPGASDRDAFAANAERCLAKALAVPDERPVLLVVSCLSSLQYTASMAVASLVRRLSPQTAIVVTGFHVSARPNDFAYAGAPFDWVLTGEPELTLVELARSLGETGGVVGGDGGARVVEAAVHAEAAACAEETAAGTEAAHRADVAARTDAAAPRLIQGMPLPHSPDELPDFEAYPYTRSGLGTLPVFMSRGCPFMMTACGSCSGAPGWRAFPPEAVRDEIERMMALRPARIDVLDPTFGLDPAWRVAALECLERVDGRRPVPVRIRVRPEAFTRGDVDLARKAGLRLELDVGTLSAKLLERTAAVPNPSAHVDHALDLLHYANAKGVLADVRLAFNQPGETRETATETLDRLQTLVDGVSTTTLRIHAASWAYAPCADERSEIDTLRERYGTRILHPEWWREGIPSERAAKAVVPSSELADLEGGDESYWRPRRDAVAEDLAAKLTGDARDGVRSHQPIGAGAAGVPHGFWAEPGRH